MSSPTTAAPSRRPQKDPASDGPLALYRARRAMGTLLPDPAQELAIEKLQSLWRALLDYTPNNGAHGWRARLGLAPTADPPPHGLYIYGSVGRGKTTDTMVAIVSLGATRPFGLRPRSGGPGLRLQLGHGDLLVMGGSCQRTWLHGIPKVAGCLGARISVQFRPDWGSNLGK